MCTGLLVIQATIQKYLVCGKKRSASSPLICSRFCSIYDQLHVRQYFILSIAYRLLKPQLAIARLRLHASELFISLSVCLSVCLSVAKMQKTRFSQKLDNLEL